jgi:xanthine/uracil permease
MLLTLAGAGAALAGAHTRTAMVAMVAGLLVAGASLFVGHARVRRTSAMVGVFVVLLATTLGPVLREWALRGQSAQEAGDLTGRTLVWSAVFKLRRTPLQEIFGSGLSNKSFNGLPIDSNWVATYLDQGWFGVSVDAMLLLLLLALAISRPRGPRRAVALFLVVYCLVASITETGLGDASPYLLELVLAAALLAPPARVDSG